MTMPIGETWTGLGSTVAGLMFAWAMFQQYFPYSLRHYIERYVMRLMGFFNPDIQITFREFTGNHLKRSDVFSSIEAYLVANSTKKAKYLRAEFGKNSKTSIVLGMDDYEEITDEFQGVKLRWALHKSESHTQSFSLYPVSSEKRYYLLTFHKQHRELVTELYLKYVLEEGKAVGKRNRQRKLYTNNPSIDWWGRKNKWSHVPFEHPAKFETLAMEPEKKKEIIQDLVTFSRGKEYYEKIGKAWKRGYLLYGPPGTGKSTMIAAMANFLDYDVYDLELTTVQDNSELRRLMIDTSSKSIIVIEDIDCSLDLTGQRKKKKKEHDDDDSEEKGFISKVAKEENDNEDSKVTLSGLLNFIDGLWSACGGERLIVFTTNHVEKLDPALIRRGRMDKHIELSYCCFEGFKVLAKNYLDLDSHYLFNAIQPLMDETVMTPADVAENLMPKTIERDSEACLWNLIKALEKVKEEAKLKAEEEEKGKEESRTKEKEEEGKWLRRQLLRLKLMSLYRHKKAEL